MPAQVSMLSLARQSSQLPEGMSEGTALSPMDDANNNSNSNSSNNGNDTTGNAAQKKTRKRVRHFTSNDRAAHRVFERARREAFREKLIELAELLPSLEDADASRLSKHMVVHESIDRHHEQIRQIDALTRERDELRAEVTRWRVQAGLSGVPSSVPGSEAELSPPLSLSLPLSISLTMPPEQQQPTAPAILLDNTELPLPLPDMGHSVSESAPWSWSPSFNLHRDMGEGETSLSWGGLDDPDIGQLVVDAMAPPVHPMPQDLARTDGHREMEDVIVVDTSSHSQQAGLLDAAPGQIMWMVS